MKEPYDILKTIIVPVNLDKASLAIVRQAAELARDHGAVVHLLHIIDTQVRTGYVAFADFLRPASLLSLTNRKSAMLQTWQSSLQVIYGVTITTEVVCGKWENCILDCAREKKADLIAVSKPVQKKWKGFFRTDPVEKIIQNSPCQVITFFSNTESIEQWKNIVIPVVGFVPELRIKTIFRIARNSHVKIHLITLAPIRKEGSLTQFPFIIDTLKMLKSTGNIQVQCSCIKAGVNAEHDFVVYANSIQADVLITSRKIPHSGFSKLWRGLIPGFLQFSSFDPETMYQPSV